MGKKQEQKKGCFVVGPIGDDDSEDRIHADWLLEEIIQPVFSERFPDFHVTRSDKISEPGRIDAQVISALLDSELVIADLTTLNPNAFYEIGIRHVMQLPIIHMHLEGERIPFDIGSYRSIKFSRKRPRDLKAARLLLADAVEATLQPDHKVDNPVTVARGKVEFSKTATPIERALQEELSQLKRQMSELSILRNLMIHQNVKISNINRRASLIGQFGFDPIIEFKIAAVGVTSPAQLHAFADRYLVSHFERHNVVSVMEDNIIVRVPDTADNRNQIKVLEEEARFYEHPISIDVLF